MSTQNKENKKIISNYIKEFKSGELELKGEGEGGGGRETGRQLIKDNSQFFSLAMIKGLNTM